MTRFATACAVLLGLWIPSGDDRPAKPTDFECELAALNVAIAAAVGASEPITPAERAAAIAELLSRRASLTGSALDLQHASTALEMAMQWAGPIESLVLFSAELKLKTHRVREAKQLLEALPDPADTERVQILRADIAVQDGDYANPKRVYESIARSHPTWDRIARLAHLELILGNPDRADALYAKAQEMLTAKEMRQYAWLELQRGFLEFRRGRIEPALAHYERADRAYSGYWMTQDYIAESLVARAERSSDLVAMRQAATIYERLLTRSPRRPQIEQALGDVYVLLGDTAQARVHHERALTSFLESVRRGDTQYFHHLAGYYSDVAIDGSEALRWASKDLQMRSGYASRDALAWALFRSGNIERAKHEMDAALAPGIRDAHVFFHAAMINLAAEHSDEGNRLLREASAVNPQYASFHVHR